ncbi:hypothetical protein ACFVR1_17680 [Psychrobacillus sp. NPDC058041]|uniref:hypothetical protein n=1 Tax=Psychrobacillus sp. NPDC058041 TaxID=3346310 RepID=UPI0036DA36CE
MSRLLVMTVGMTHSGRTIFAKALENELSNSAVIDQDKHVEFLNTYYRLHNQCKYVQVRSNLIEIPSHN